MARDPQDKEIDGIKFTVRPLPGMKGLTMLPRLNKVLGPAIAALGAGSDASKGSVNFESLKDALALLGERLTESEMESLTRGLLYGTTFQPTDGTPGGELLPQFDLVMQGRPETALKLLAFAVEVNYSGFLPGLLALGARAISGGKSALNSPRNDPKSGQPGA
jgi:hypothetical protein